MKILIAPDKFKGMLSADKVASSIGRAVRKIYPDAEIMEQPMADGGEGSLDLFARALPAAQRHRLEVTGPLRKPVFAEYLLNNGTAYIEVAEACGLKHVPVPRRNPGEATTIGVGQLIDDAIARGASQVYLFLGGSATNDAGAGMAAALGLDGIYALLDLSSVTLADAMYRTADSLESLVSIRMGKQRSRPSDGRKG